MQKQQTIYAFLQGIYEKELPKKLIDEMPKKMKPLLAVIETLSNSESRKAVKELIEFTDSIPSQDLDILETTLAADYARLFLSINKVPPHPSESTYREGVMMQHYRDEVLKTYWGFGVSAKKEFTEPEDHIATELSFMALFMSQSQRCPKQWRQQRGEKVHSSPKRLPRNASGKMGARAGTGIS